MLIALDKEDIIKNNSSSKSTTLVVFKVFNKKTPELLTRKLFRRNNNYYSDEPLPLTFKGLGTKVIIGDNEQGISNHNECLIYYYFTAGIIPPKIELDNILFVYRKGLDDEEFDRVEYFNYYYLDGVREEAKKLNKYWSKYMVDVLNDFIKNPKRYK